MWPFNIFLQFIFLSTADIGAAPVDPEPTLLSGFICFNRNQNNIQGLNSGLEVVIDWVEIIHSLIWDQISSIIHCSFRAIGLHYIISWRNLQILCKIWSLIPPPLNLGREHSIKKVLEERSLKIKVNGKWVWEMLKIFLTPTKTHRLTKMNGCQQTEAMSLEPEWKSASTKWGETTKTGPAATNFNICFSFKNVKTTICWGNETKRG